MLYGRDWRAPPYGDKVMIIERQQGIVLVIVLWVVTLLAVMATGFAYSMRMETVLAAYSRDRAQLRALAEAGVNYAIMRLLSVNPALEPEQLWPTDGTIQELRFGPGQVRVSVVDAAGLVDLNTASR
ncbi:MAG: general secretion pathway protein GspK, partial [Anaerolineales bacterium]|nr:general secretion pathway protein GspK [Anaerolineales bacterium]